MLAALESLRSDRLNAMVTVVQKNMRRRMAVKKYTELRQATIKVQTWWRGILARRLVEHIRREVSARRMQTQIRRFIQRKQFLDTRHAITIFQSRKSQKRGIICLPHSPCRCTWCPSTVAHDREEAHSGRYPPAVPIPWNV
jgi:Myosin heavy chain